MYETPMDFEYHPACLLLPRMSDEEFEALRASIREGYDRKKPIMLYEDKILDGRHRYEACKLENVLPDFDEVEDIDPYDFVRREHTARRSWKSQEQKALVIGELIEKSAEFQQRAQEIREEANKARSEAAKKQHEISTPRHGEEKPTMVVPQSVGTPKDGRNKGSAIKAELLDVNRGAVERAAIIKNKAPALAEKVAAGDMFSTVIPQDTKGNTNMPTGKSSEKVVVTEMARIRIKTPVVCKILSCDSSTLRLWEKKYPRVFAPVRRQKKGNIYRPKQVRIMASERYTVLRPRSRYCRHDGLCLA